MRTPSGETAAGGCRSRAPELVTSLVLAVLVLGPALGPGVVLSYDLVWSPDPRLTPFALGVGVPAPRAVPSDAVGVALGHLLTAPLAQKVVLVGVLVLAGAGAARLARELRPGLPSWAAAVAAGAAVWNPFVLERLVVGHWTVLLGYGAAPHLALVARRAREGRRRDLVSLAAGTALSGVGGANALVIVLLVVLPVVLLPRPAVRALLAALAATAAAAAAWAVPALAAGVTSAASGSAAFAPHPDTPWGTVGSLLTGGAFWSQATHPGERASWLLSGGALVLALAALVAVSRAARASRWLVVLVPGAVGLALCLAAAHDPGGLWTSLVAEVPGVGVLRDTQKVLAPLVTLTAAGTGILAAAAASSRWARPAGVALAALVALTPVLTLPSLAWGAGGRVVAVTVPPGLRDAAAVLSGAPAGTVGLLPWSQYRRYPWNGDRVSLTVVPRMVDQYVLFDDGLPLDSGRVPGEDPAAARVGAALDAGADPVEALAAVGVRYVVVESGAGGPDPGVTAPAGAAVLADEAGVLVLDLLPGAPLDPPSLGPARTMAWLLTVAALVAALTAGALLLLRRAWPRRRAARQGGYPVVESAP